MYIRVYDLSRIDKISQYRFCCAFSPDLYEVVYKTSGKVEVKFPWIYFTYKGVWRRVRKALATLTGYAEGMFQYVMSSDVMKGSLYAFSLLPSLYVFVPSKSDLKTYFTDVFSTFLLGTCVAAPFFGSSTVDVHSWDIFHSSNEHGCCDPHRTFVDFCNFFFSISLRS